MNPINSDNINEFNDNGETELHISCWNNDIDRMLDMIELGADINLKTNDVQKDTPLHMACYNDNINMVRELINYDADVNSVKYDNSRPLHIACYNNNINMVRELINNGADVNVIKDNNNTPLNIACYNNNIEIVRELLNNGANINIIPDSDNPLITACGCVQYEQNNVDNNIQNPIEVVKELLKYNIDINNKGEDGTTALHAACMIPHIDVIKELIERGANINETDIYDNTPLHFLSSHNEKDMELFRYFINNTDNIDVKTYLGRTAFHNACIHRNMEAVQELLNYGADINAKTNEDETALFLCCKFDCEDIVRELFDKGCDININIDDIEFLPEEEISDMSNDEIKELNIKRREKYRIIIEREKWVRRRRKMVNMRFVSNYWRKIRDKQRFN
jgi:ankyrin repeat protein